MNIRPTVHSESSLRIDSPAYRVNFWERPDSTFAWNLEAWILSDVADVAEVLAWIAEKAVGRRYELFIETEEPQDSPSEAPRTANLLRLQGTNPNAV